MTSLLTCGRDRDGDIEAGDGFCGAGGSSQALRKVPGIRVVEGINHSPHAIRVHALNFPDAEHLQTDIQTTCVSKRKPRAFKWDSPACPHWTDAAGRPMWFDKINQYAIPGLEPEISETGIRSRALMTEVPLYLEAMWLTGFPVLAGVVENVPQVRKWAEWDKYLHRFHMLGYKTKLIALNSAHAVPVRTKRCPQSRDRAYLAYWLEALGRDPDWDKWLRPRAWCPRCDRRVWAMQVFKDPRKDMGVYGIKSGQYVYRCPNSDCRGQVVHPEVIGAATALDFTKPITAIGDREAPLAPMTMARIGMGVVKYGEPFLVPAGGTWRTSPTPVSEPMPTRTTRESDGIAVPPIEIAHDTEGRSAAWARQHTGTASVTIPPMLITMRGGGSLNGARKTAAPMPTLTANGNHIGLMQQPTLDLMVPYYGNGNAAPADEPMGTLTTRDRYALSRARNSLEVDPRHIIQSVERIQEITLKTRELKKDDAGRADDDKRHTDAIARLGAEAARTAERMGLESVLFRMMKIDESHRGMAFDDDFVMPDDISAEVATRLYGNAVTPPPAEVIVSALSEIIHGIELDRELVTA